MKLYSAGAVISISGQPTLLENSPYIGESIVSQLLGISSGNLMLNKEYLIYADDYTAFNYSNTSAGSPAKGSVLVLMEKNSLHSMSQSVLSDAVVGYRIHGIDNAFLQGGAEILFCPDSPADTLHTQ